MEASEAQSIDRLSNIPDELIVTILTYLPLRDAARTSILSSYWRNKWRNIPFLEFNNLPQRPILRNRSTAEVIRIIGQIVSVHHRPILKFSLYLYCRSSYDEINPVIDHVLESGVKELTLKPRDYEHHKLPSKIYSHRQFTNLTLRNCELDPPPATFLGFPKLTSLILFEVSISCDVLTSIISKCPLIVILDVRCQDLVGSIEINGPNIKNLIIRAPLKSVRLASAPRLQKIELSFGSTWYIRYLDKPVFPDCIGFHNHLQTVESLQLDALYFQGLTRSHAFRDTLYCLDTLELTGIAFGLREVMATLALTQNSPSLRKLTIGVQFAMMLNEMRDIELFDDIYGRSRLIFDELKEVKMEFLTCSRLEVEMIKFVVARSPVLETMTLIPDSRTEPYRVRQMQRELDGVIKMSRSANINIVFNHQTPIFNDFRGFF